MDKIRQQHSNRDQDIRFDIFALILPFFYPNYGNRLLTVLDRGPEAAWCLQVSVKQDLAADASEQVCCGQNRNVIRCGLDIPGLSFPDASKPST